MVDTPSSAAAKYGSLLRDNSEGIANRGGYFYTGKIGRGLTRKAASAAVNGEVFNGQWENSVLLLETLCGCMADGNTHETLVVKLVARLTPHTPVPPLQHYREILPRRSSYPRDQLLIQLFDSNPLMWHLFLLGADNPAYFARCFELTIGLLVIAIARWHSFANARERLTSFSMMSYQRSVELAANPADMGETPVMASENPSGLTSTLLLLEVIRVAQLAPAPLANVGDIAGFMKAGDLVKVLTLLFKYASDNPPAMSQYTYTKWAAPASGTKPPKDGQWSRNFPRELHREEHLGPLRSIFIENMETLGPLYSLYFPAAGQ
jgi:hypothetical protein